MENDILIPEDFSCDDRVVKEWKFYKDYLREKHAIMDNESKELEKLFFLSGQSPEAAVKILNIIMAQGYVCI